MSSQSGGHVVQIRRTVRVMRPMSAPEGGDEVTGQVGCAVVFFLYVEAYDPQVGKRNGRKVRVRDL
jgi:hypothetical protein